MTMAALLMRMFRAPYRSVAVSHGALPVSLAGDVEMHVDGLAPGGAYGGFDLLALGISDVAEDDLGAFPGEACRLGRPLSAGPATDQRHLSIQLSHSILPAVCAVIVDDRSVDRSGST